MRVLIERPGQGRAGQGRAGQGRQGELWCVCGGAEAGMEGLMLLHGVPVLSLSLILSRTQMHAHTEHHPSNQDKRHISDTQHTLRYTRCPRTTLAVTPFPTLTAMSCHASADPGQDTKPTTPSS
jgi:hypothetical protein